MQYSSFLLEDFYDKEEASSRLDLSSSGLRSWTLEDILQWHSAEERDVFTNKFFNSRQNYTQAYGSESLRQGLLQFYKDIQVGNIFLTAGAAEAINLIMNNINGTCVIQRPIYQSLYQILLSRGEDLVFWKYSQRESFEENFLRLQKLKNSFDYLVINNPNNPMGIAFQEKELLQLIDWTRDSGARIIADEVFRPLALRKLPSVVDLDSRAISIGSFSKAFCLPGLRLGWIASHDVEFLDLMRAQRAYASLRTAWSSELIAEEFLHRADKLMPLASRRLREGIELLGCERDHLPFELEISLSEIQSPSVLARLTSKLSEEFELKFSLASGEFFGEEYQDYFRLCLDPDKLACWFENL